MLTIKPKISYTLQSLTHN